MTSQRGNGSDVSFHRCNPNRQLVGQRRWWESNPRLPLQVPPARCSALSYGEDVFRSNSLFLLFFSNVLKQLDGLLKCLLRDVMFTDPTSCTDARSVFVVPSHRCLGF